jgi:hypothetical protein
MVENGAITKTKVDESYQSWRSHAEHGNCRGLIAKYDELYSSLFGRSEENATTDF